MSSVVSFTFNPFQENTYVVHDETKECVIIDPGCYNHTEQKELTDFINDNELKPVRLLNTHCHIDHIFGNRFVADKYALQLEMHKDDLVVLDSDVATARLYELSYDESPKPGSFLAEGDKVTFGNTTFEVLFTPGHSPGSITFYCPNDRYVIVGDVLFNMSIGRVDLPGGDFNTLMNSIANKLLPLEDDVVVYAGHMNETTIGFERENNPFLVGVD